jgi:hypothetical protein
MIKWMTNYIAQQREARHKEERRWKVSMNGDIWLSMPLGLFRQGQRDKWGKILATAISRFQKHWPDTHIYIRFLAHRSWIGTDILNPTLCERVGTTKEKDQIFLLPDCKDHSVCEDALAGSGYGAFGRSIFVLDHKPANWKETITRLFEIAVKLSGGQPAADFESELSTCRCLCYSMDDDLVIEKVDLPENIVISILEDIARENDLDLVIERK